MLCSHRLSGLSPNRRAVRIAVVNAAFKPQALAVKLIGIETRGAGTAWRLTGNNLDAVNKVGQAPGVTIQRSTVLPLSRGLTVAPIPISTSIYEFPVAGSR
jgi:alpha-N-arabinofuranosidase